MRVSITRHLGELSARRARAAGAAGPALRSGGRQRAAPREFNAVDYVSYLLDIDAEIEHALMVQYLYAAYSLGGPQVPEPYRDQVRGWQEVVLGVAKEEMGHLISVQNVLRLIGAPLNFEREDYPWDTPFYPYPFALEPLTLPALAKYIFAESPADWSGPQADEIKALLPPATDPPHRVGELFDELLEKLQDRTFLSDDVFQPETWPYQAKWDEWGRGYQGGARGNAEGAGPPDTPDVLVAAVASRDDAVAALKQIAEQGEAPATASAAAPSHFARFLRVYTEMKALEPVWTEGNWAPWRNVAVNPYIPGPDEDPPRGDGHDPITHPEAALWGHLFNVRYRMVLAYLTHSFDLDGGSSQAGPWSPRGTVISATFGEMYNLRAIATYLVQTPLCKNPGHPGKFAGPPFQMPYTLSRPAGEANRWRLHRNLLLASEPLVAELLATSDPSRHRYLFSLREADRTLLGVIDRILNGFSNYAPR